MLKTHWVVAAACAVALSACGHGTEERSASGGLSGVVAGAVIAGPVGALAGAAIGGGAGAVTAKEKGEKNPPDEDADDDADAARACTGDRC